jgi:Flp pilus assembly protein TadD
MPLGEHGGGRLGLSHHRGVLIAVAATLMLGACAQLGADAPGQSLAQQEAKPAEQQMAAQPQTELEKAIAYWGEQYTKKPRDKTAAISYVRNLKADGQKERAFAIIQQASMFHGDDREVASEYGRLALEFEQVALAQKLLAYADDPTKPDWRVISARGTALAKQGDYKGAIAFYERALKLSPDQPSVMNNLALAYAAGGQPAKAEPLLRQAAEHTAAPSRVRQNLALVVGLQGKYDEAQRLAQADLPTESAMSDVDYLRRMVKLEPQHMPSTPAGSGTAVAATPATTSPRLRPAHIDTASSGNWDARVASAAAPPLLKPSQQ